MRSRDQSDNTNKTVKVIGSIVTLILVGVVIGYGLIIEQSRLPRPTDDIAEQAPYQHFEDKPQPIPTTPNNNAAHPQKEQLGPPSIDKNLNRPLAFLVVGIDERQHDSGRTDTIIVFTSNPEDKTIKMVSIPRDTKTELADVAFNSYDKINHAYSRGEGLQSTKKTVEQFLDIPIDYTVSVNMQGFEQLVDLFGGVQVNVPRDFSIKGYNYQKGLMTLDGEAALYYVRERASSSDFDRNQRQQQVLRALIDKSSRFSTLTKIDDILRIIGNNVNTNLTPLQLFQLQRMYGKVREQDIEQLQLSGTDEWTDSYYFIVNETKKAEVIQTLHNHLQLDNTQEKH